MTLDKLYELFRANPVITTDSRDCPPDSIFFALKGENFNGNQFAAMALDKGCRLAVVDEPQCATAGDDRYWVVDDVLETLRALARLHRRTLGTPMVGITGTNGKTTTKELVGAVLAQRYNVLYTQGNFNNEIGVPKTLLRLRPEHEIAVVEMGASHPGDIKRLVEIAEPDCGLITNVGRAHLQGFGSFEGVVSTKGELYDWLRDHRDPPTVFIHAENEHLMAISHGLHLIKYGTDGQPVPALNIGYLPQYSSFDFRFPITVREVVSAGLLTGKSLFYRPSQTDQRQVDHILSLMELDALADHSIAELSGGQRQRVLMARALIGTPQLLILDEPSTYIDTDSQEQLYRMLRTINETCAVLLVSHDMGAVFQTVRNIACVNRTLHYHPAEEPADHWFEHEMGCPLELVAHGQVPHRVLCNHHH